MRKWLLRNPLRTYFLLAYGIAWMGWIPVAVYWQQVPSVRPANPVAALAPFAFGPTFAALTMAGVTGGSTAVRSLLRRLWAWRAGLRWYAFVLLSPVALLLAAAALGAALTSRTVDFSTTAAAVQFPGLSPWVLLPAAFVSGLLAGPLNEEACRLASAHSRPA